jgi:dTDP-4-amino-4,6-dideoxygalactose transaminase
LPADRDAFLALSKKHNLFLFEDAACSFGATYKGKQLGAFDNPTAYSFHPRKMITTGEGGMIITNDEVFAEKARALRSTGASVSDLDRHKARGTVIQEYFETGYNYRMTDMQAAVGIVQMSRLAEMLAQRKAQAEFYDKTLADIKGVKLPFVPEYATHSYSSYIIRLTAECSKKRDDVLKEMAACGISCRIGIQPLHHEPFYRDEYVNVSHLKETEVAARETMFLPIYPGMTPAQQKYIVAELKKVLS